MKRVIELKRVDDNALCLSRKRYGKGFQYFNEDGHKISNKKVLRRLRSLSIPPMWEEVTICKWPDGHIQATGRDLKGRKQYVYHVEWERLRQQKKFDRMKAFGLLLPKIRKHCLEVIQLPGWKIEKVLALLVLILDETGIRIGNQQYTKRNETYGLSTLRRKHLQLEDNALRFCYNGKSNKQREVCITDNLLIRHIKRSAEQPGYEIFRYRENGKWNAVDSDEVNAFIQGIMGSEFTSKDFRTWVASRLAVQYYPEAIELKNKYSRRKFTNILIRMVAEELGNTPTVCKDYYVHPTIMRLIDQRKLPDYSTLQTKEKPGEHDEVEQLILQLL